jgi:hypothetical protein
MINPIYGVNCLKLGFERYKRYCKLPIEINVSRSSVSFYISKGNNNEKMANTRISNHHTKLQRYTDKGREPWLYDNISIEFIIPNSDEDKKSVRGRVYQNSLGTIQPFDVTIYQYNSDLIVPSDIMEIFKAIIVFLNGNGYTDPFKGTFKKAKVIPRHSNIKPYNRRSTDIQSESLVSKQYLSKQRLNEISSYCLRGLITENNNTKTQYKMKQRIRLTEGDLHRIIRKCVNEALEKPFRTAETVGPFVNNRAQFLNLRTKKEQMDSDWADLRHSGAYPYGDGPNQPDGWCPKGDYVESDDDRENGDYPSNPNILNRRFWESRQRKRNAGLTEAKLHKIIKKVLKEGWESYDGEHYFAELFHMDGDTVDSEEFGIDDLKGAIKWAKEQAGAHPDLVSEVFYVDEYGDTEETGYYYGDWSC